MVFSQLADAVSLNKHRLCRYSYISNMWRHYNSKYKDLPPVMQAVIKQLTVNLTLVYLNYDSLRCEELSQYLRNNCIQCFQVEFNPRLKDCPAKGFMYMRKNKDAEAKAKLRHIVNTLWVYQFDLAKKPIMS